ncbi:MAG TPA: hypothetical protein VH186_26695 [Chloroflexia bacterium]|nr:hypothetical protein [Chloroflexia bacterium]
MTGVMQDRRSKPQQNINESGMSLWLKLIFWFVIANAYAGAISLMVFPDNTENLFFWKITPPINSAMFGGLYLVAGTAVLMATLHGRWEKARYLFPMIFCFSGLLLLTTLLHTDKLIPGVRLTYWLAVYIVAFLAGIFFFWWHERRESNWQVVQQPIKLGTRLVALVAGTGIALYVLVSFVAPQVVIDQWPWPITPLMVRVFASWLSALGAGLLWFAVERDWGRVHNLVNLLSVVPVLTILLLLLYTRDLKPSQVNLLPVVIGLISLEICALFMQWWQRKTPLRAS